MANQVPPASQPTNPPPKPTRRDLTPILVALIGLTGTLITVMMSSPLIVRYYDRRMATQSSINLTLTTTLVPVTVTTAIEDTATANNFVPTGETATLTAEVSAETPFAGFTATSPQITDTSGSSIATTQVTEIVTRSLFPEDIVSARWDEGYYLTSLAFGDGEWALVFSQETGLTTQGWNIVDGEPEDVIEQRWEDGFDLTSLAYSPQGWVLVFSKGTGFTDQAWRRDPAVS